MPFDIIHSKFIWIFSIFSCMCSNLSQVVTNINRPHFAVFFVVEKIILLYTIYIEWEFQIIGGEEIMPDIETIRPMLILILYLVIFIIQIILLVKAIKKKEKRKWIKAFALEIFSIILSIILWQYYESLPGYGFMAGLTYLGEVIFSIGSTILSTIMLFISICARIVIYIKSKKNNNRNANL